MKIAIVGAGISGLVSAKYCLEHGHEIEVLEQTGNYGGCWRYTEHTDVDKNCLPTHSAMYKNLKTNLPKEIMVFTGLEHRKQLKSYVSQADILEYIQRYAKKFNLAKHISYHKCVLNIKPDSTEKWILKIKDAKTKTEEIKEYDSVMICNGHFFQRRMPIIDGMSRFNGKQIHSQDFKSPEIFKNKIVVVVGAGPSGVDIAKHVSTTAKKVIVSHKHKPKTTWVIPEGPNIETKPVIDNLYDNGCNFIDGTFEDVDVIIYCTGYDYSFPFLKPDSGVTIDDSWVRYLYKHTINIEHPTMAIIGLSYGASLFALVDLQARYFLAYLDKVFRLPSKEKMLEYAISEQNLRYDLGWPKRFAHYLPDIGEKLSHEFASEAGLEPTPPVIFKIHQYITEKRFHSDSFTVLDNDTFEVRKIINE